MATSVPTPGPGLSKTHARNMHTSHRGFIPLVAIVIVGLIVAAGGTIAAVSMRSSGEKPEEAKSEVVTTTTEGAYSGPVSSRVESLEEDKEVVAPKSVSTSVEANVETKVEIRAGTREICAEAQTKAEPSGRSLIADIHVLCEQLLKGNYTEENVRDKEQALKEKWQLWRIAGSPRTVIEPEQSEPEPQETPEPDPERYTESNTYPIIISFTDNHGNLYKGSDYNGYQGPYASKKKVALRVGDTIKATAEAKDPKGRTLEYNWNASSQHFNDAVGRGLYTTSNTLSYTLTPEDLQSAGETFRLVYQVRVAGTSSYRFGGGQYDDTGFIDYQLSE